MRAGKRLFPSMDPTVSLKILFGRCRIRTEGAVVGLFPSVSPQVYVKMVAAERRIRADGAREGLLHIESLQGDAYN